ncbi:MAG: SAM-dependent methyltransferase [Gammaproteobacteria bacterium]|nr:SAM-dependent methyltransferase [Gammaproteobacteria bacterium]
MQLEASSLPHPDAASAAHSEQCAAYIRARIAHAGGSISFAEFMQHALYAPGLGYYAAGATKFGSAGDFVTAPEVSPVFGAVVARQCAQVLQAIGGGSILEIGAGSGRLAVDLLTTLDEMGVMPEHYDILEVSADLRQRQETLLKKEVGDIADRVRWLDALPQNYTGVIVANEVLDALPVERFVKRTVLQQQHVQATTDGFCIVEKDAPEHTAGRVAAIEADIGHAFATGYVSEVSLGLSDWVTSLVDSLEKGAALLFDYGLSRREYYAKDRSDGWLRCHFRHHAHNDPLILTGIQDLTAWVDFTSVAEAAVAADAEILGYVSQAHFLLNGGLAEELEKMTTLSQQQQTELSAAVKLLTLPGEMGEHFKCFGFSKGACPTPAAFDTADRTHTL